MDAGELAIEGTEGSERRTSGRKDQDEGARRRPKHKVNAIGRNMHWLVAKQHVVHHQSPVSVESLWDLGWMESSMPPETLQDVCWNAPDFAARG
jgi:hypothetical protein